jgi:hypothetical protein
LYLNTIVLSLRADLELGPLNVDPEDVRILLSDEIIVESGGVDDDLILNDAATPLGVIGIDSK